MKDYDRDEDFADLHWVEEENYGYVPGDGPAPPMDLINCKCVIIPPEFMPGRGWPTFLAWWEVN